MSKYYYYRLCLEQSTEWLQKCAANPANGMTKMNIALIRLALRNRLRSCND